MDILALVDSIRRYDSNFEESDQVLKSLIAQSPDEFIHQLCMAIPSATDPKLQISAINFLTIPIERCGNCFVSNSSTSNISDKVKNEVHELCMNFLSYPEEIATVASKVLVFYANLSISDTNNIFHDIISNVVPENGQNLSLAYFKTLNALSSGIYLQGEENVATIFQLYNFITNVELENPIKREILQTIRNILHTPSGIEELDQRFFDVFGYIWSICPNFPEECFGILVTGFMDYGAIICQLPNLAEQTIAAITSDDEKARLSAIDLLTQSYIDTTNDTFSRVNPIVDGQEMQFIQIIINLLENDESDKIIKPDTFAGKCKQVLTELCLVDFQNVLIHLQDYVASHINSESVGERTVAILLFTIAFTEGKEGTTQFKEISPQIIAAALQDSTERVVYECIKAVINLINCNLLNIDEALISLMVPHACSDNIHLSCAALEALFTFTTKCSVELRTFIASAVFDFIREVSDENNRANLLRNLTDLCKKLSNDVSASIVEPAVNLAQEILESSDAETPAVSLSAAIGFAASVFMAAGLEVSEIAGEFYKFGVQLIESGFTKEGIVTVAAIMKNFATAYPEFLETASELIIEQLPQSTDNDDLTSILQLAEFTVPHTESEELLTVITNCLMELGQVSTIPPEVRVSVLSVLVAVLERMPDMITQRLHEFFEIAYFAGISTITTSQRLKVIVIAGRYFTEDLLYARAVSETISDIGYVLNNRKKWDAKLLTMLLEIAQVVDPQCQRTFPAMKMIAQQFFTHIAPHVDQESASRIIELLPIKPVMRQQPSM